MKSIILSLLALMAVALGGCANNSDSPSATDAAPAAAPANDVAVPDTAAPAAASGDTQAEAPATLTLGHILGEWKAVSWTVHPGDPAADPNATASATKDPPEPHLALTIRQDGTYTLTNTDAASKMYEYVPSAASKLSASRYGVKSDKPGVYSGNLTFPGEDKMVIDMRPDHPFTVTITGTTMVWNAFRTSPNSTVDLTWQRVY